MSDLHPDTRSETTSESPNVKKSSKNFFFQKITRKSFSLSVSLFYRSPSYTPSPPFSLLQSRSIPKRESYLLCWEHRRGEYLQIPMTRESRKIQRRKRRKKPSNNPTKKHVRHVLFPYLVRIFFSTPLYFFIT